MHIVHVTRETGSDVRYGLRKSLLPVLNALESRGHTVELFDQDRALQLTASAPLYKGAERLYLALLRRRYGAVSEFFLEFVRERLRVAWAAARSFCREPAAYVHCHDPLLAHLFRRFDRCLGGRARWGYTQHAFGRYVQSREGINLPQSVQKHLWSWELAASQGADWVIVPSHSGLAEMQREWGLLSPPSSWHMIPHARPVLQRSSGLNVRERHAIGERPLIIAVGQLVPLKRFHLIIAAVAALPAELAVHLLILGNGPLENSLHAFAASKGLEQRFHILPTDDVASYFAAADIYVSTSSTEAYGLANCEALSAGLPAICTEVGAVAEVLANGACLLAGPDDLAGNLLRLLESSQERHSLAERARSRAAQWLSAEQVALQLENIYASARTD